MNELAVVGAQAGGDLMSQVFSHFTQKRRNKLQLEANKELADYQYGKDLQMWRAQNQYNNPANQMNRLRQAGLNPNLIYGSGSAVGNTSGQMPKYQAPRAEYDYDPIVQNAPNVLGMYQDTKIKNAQADLLQSQKEMLDKKQSTELITQQLKNQAIISATLRNNRDRITNKYFPEFQEENLRHLRNSIILQGGERKLQDAELAQKGVTLERSKYDAHIRRIEYEWLRDHGIRPQDPITYRMAQETGLLDFFKEKLTKAPEVIKSIEERAKKGLSMEDWKNLAKKVGVEIKDWFYYWFGSKNGLFPYPKK